jgi:glycosyltransferase involved in cell wall biosynthesis
VLEGADFKRFRPRALVVEANEKESWQSSLLEEGYLTTLFDGINVILVRKEEAELAESLAVPSNVLDGFVPERLAGQLALLERELQELKARGFPEGPESVVLFPPPRSAPRVERPAPLRRMKSLVVLSSSNQLYSGIGRHLFETVVRLADFCEYEFAIDDGIGRNVEILRNFCQANGFPLNIGKHNDVGLLDLENSALGQLVADSEADVVECFSWANAAANQTVLEAVGDRLLTYTPHYQPVESVPMTDRQAAKLDAVHHRMLERADLIFCDSPFERRHFWEAKGVGAHCVYAPIGCDFDSFRPGPLQRRPELLSLGDHAEPRKRFDRVLSVFGGVCHQHRNLRLAVIGNRSPEAAHTIPEYLRANVDVRGYISEAELRQAYSQSTGLILLSDHEAFGLPILEALASGTPVFLSDIPVLRSLFDRFEGVYFCPADDESAAALIGSVLQRPEVAVAAAVADRERLRAFFDWENVCALRWNATAAAWYFRQVGVGST